jgi:putative ABC transport system permease protein
LFKNYLLTSLRHFTSQKGYGLINIIGLSIGMTAVILIGVFVRAHFMIDSWHGKGDRLCKILIEVHTPGSNRFVSQGTDGPFAAALEADYPGVEKGVRIGRTRVWVKHEDRGFEQRVMVTEPEFFDLFDFQGVDCDPKTAFQTPYSILVTERMVVKFFRDEDPIGKTVSLDGVDIKGEYTVTGVIQDPGYSSIQFAFVTSTMAQGGYLDWAETWNPGAQHRHFETWILLREGVSASDLKPKIQDSIERYLGPDDGKKHSYHVQPLKRAHLYWGRDYTASGIGEIDRVISHATIAGLYPPDCVHKLHQSDDRPSLPTGAGNRDAKGHRGAP